MPHSDPARPAERDPGRAPSMPAGRDRENGEDLLRHQMPL